LLEQNWWGVKLKIQFIVDRPHTNLFHPAVDVPNAIVELAAPKQKND